MADSQIIQIRLAVLRAVQDLQSKHERTIKPAEIYEHPSLEDEDHKRILNALQNARSGAKPQIINNEAGHIELTASGLFYLKEHDGELVTSGPVTPPHGRQLPSPPDTRPKPNGGDHVSKTLLELELRAQSLEAEAKKIRATAAGIREALAINPGA
jgi:hypothetical protein